MELRSSIIGIVIGFLLAGCAGFSYKYYGLKDVDYTKGILLGEKEVDDLDFIRCAPNDNIKNPCIVIFADSFFKMKQDYEDTKQKLSDCERNQ